MTNNEFDRKINEVVSDETIPFSEENWGRMQQMLDKKSPRRLILLPLFYKPIAAAAAMVAVVVTVYFATRPGDDIIQQQVNNSQNQPAIVKKSIPQTTEAKEDTAQPVIIMQPSIQPAHHNAPQPLVRHEKSNEQKVPPVAEDNIAPQQEHIAVTPQDKTQPHKSNKPTQQFAYPHYDDEEAGRQSKLTVGINSGMTFYQSQNNFAAGLVVKNKLSRRLSVQAGVGFVQSRQNATIKNVVVTEEPIISPSDTSFILGYETTVTETYEAYSKNLPYIQFNPGVSIAVFNRMSATVGVDLQKAAVSNSVIDTLNKHLMAEGKKMPSIDAGLTFNLNYNITKNIGFGVSYRNSMAGKASDNIQYIKRNYFLVNLQYIFNPE